MTHICVGNLTIIGSDNGLSPGRRQAITWTNVGILLIGPLGTNFNEMLIEINTFSFKKIHLKMSSGKWRPFCLYLNVLKMTLYVLILDKKQRKYDPSQRIFWRNLRNTGLTLHLLEIRWTIEMFVNYWYFIHRIWFSNVILRQYIEMFNTLRQTQNGCHFADDIFKRTFKN